MSKPSFKDWRSAVEFYRRASDEEQMLFIAGVVNVRDEATMAAGHLKNALMDDGNWRHHVARAIDSFVRIYGFEDVLLKTVLADTADIEPEARLQ